MEFWMAGTIHCKKRRVSSPTAPGPAPTPLPGPLPARAEYLLDQPHLELGEEQLGEEASGQ